MSVIMQHKSLTRPLYHFHQSIRGSHGAIVDRIRKTLYYGKNKGAKEVMECPSLPLTEVTVELFEKSFKKRSEVINRNQLPRGNKSPKGSPKPKGKIYTKDDVDTRVDTSCTKELTDSVTFGRDLVKGLDILDMTYASSVSRSASISPCSMVLALIYMDRLKQQNPDYLASASSCDLFLVSMMVASKYLFDDGEDEEVFNDDWAISGELQLKKLNKLELEFLSAIDWRLHVKPVEFFKKLELVETLVAWKETRKRRSNGQYTYHDLVCLESMLDWRSVSENFIKIIAVTCLTYSAILVSLFGLSLLTHRIQNHIHGPVAPLSMTTNHLSMTTNHLSMTTNHLSMTPNRDSNFSYEMVNRQITRDEPNLIASCGRQALPVSSTSQSDRNPTNRNTKENGLPLRAKLSNRDKVDERSGHPPLVVTNS